jgi:hypothetical protein
MPQMSTSELVSAVAAVVSAIAGGLAVVAAFRSADSARKALLSADAAERRAVLREVVSIGKDVELEATRCVEAAELSGRSHRDLAIFVGGLGESRHQLVTNALADKTNRAKVILNEGRIFVIAPSTLERAPAHDIDRVLTKLRAFAF